VNDVAKNIFICAVVLTVSIVLFFVGRIGQKTNIDRIKQLEQITRELRAENEGLVRTVDELSGYKQQFDEIDRKYRALDSRFEELASAQRTDDREFAETIERIRAVVDKY
jgi:Tfp pilus assembly protein PilO